MARFCRAYPAYTAEAALDMPSVRFWVMFEQIKRLEAAEDFRSLEVALYSAYPGKHSEHLVEFMERLRTAGKPTATAYEAPSLPVQSIQGPFVNRVEGSVLQNDMERFARQGEEQQEAYRTGGWTALWQVLEEQRAINQGNR